MGNGRPRLRIAILGVLLASALCAARSGYSQQDPQKEQLDRQYQAAVADYEAGRYAQAAGQLEKLLPYAPKSFELRELLGMAYVALNQDDKAIAHLKAAVQINPESAEARTNYGAALMHAGEAIPFECFANHARRKRADFHDMIGETERACFVCNSAEDNGRIGEAVIFAIKDELRCAQLVSNNRRAWSVELSVCDLNRESLGRSAHDLAGTDCREK